MAQTNKRVERAQVFTEGGAPAYPHLTPIQTLRRSVLSCLLWESEFYEDGASIADRIMAAADQVSAHNLAQLAIEARTVHNLRHVPLLLLCALAKKGGRIVGDTIAQTIQRADELAELVSVYWRDGKRPLTKQMKLGLARAMHKFDAYDFAKYNRDKAVKLRDVMFLVHPKPIEGREALYKQIADDELPVPDTWEVALSGGADKKATFERLIAEGALGYLALLRNLRNMMTAGCDVDLVKGAILARKGAHRVLPFRYIAAARACPQLEPAIDAALLAALGDAKPFSGRTLILVDVSGSMAAPLSARSDLTRMDAAAALASLWPGEARVFSFSNGLVECPPRKGLAGVDAIVRSQSHGGTELAGAVKRANTLPHDRLVVITDEQATSGRVPDPVAERAYMVNVASAKNGVGYGKWTHLDGFSESILKFIHAHEHANAD